MSTAFVVNGAACEAADDRCSLVEHLRDSLHLKGTRYGCGQERCGACVVLVDGAPRAACGIEVASLGGRAVTTIEAVAGAPEGRLLLKHFERLQAAQCGFCSSGILVAASVFVRESADGSQQAIAQALDGHLCRCGAHPRIVAAVAAAWHDWRAGGSRT
jgi:nicotinate dehydrogenase subunit A